MRYGRGALRLFLVLLTFAQASWAATITVRARLSASTIYLGESVLLELRINGIRNPELPEVHLPNIDVSREQGQSFRNSSISIINGHTTRLEEFGYVAHYRLRPRISGVLHIPPLTVTYAGRTYRSQPLTLEVDRPASQDYLLVEVYTDKPRYVLGERVTLTLDVSLRALTMHGKELDIDPFFSNQPPHLQIPWFESLGDWKTTDMETFVRPFLGQQRPGFFINDYYDQQSFFRTDRLTFTFPRHRTRRRRPSGTYTYFTYRLQKVFRPIHAGVQTIPPVLAKATLPTLLDAHGRARRTERFVAVSSPLTVEVHPVPNDGRPPSFNGAVGRFRLEVMAAPTVLKVGDPLTLTVTIHRQGDSLLETVHPLRLQEQAALRRDFKIHPDPLTIKTKKDTKTFTYTVRPRRADVRAVPPLEMASYDPDTKRFQILHSNPIPLQVEEAPTLKASEIIVSAQHSRPKSTLGRQLAEGLLANYTGVEVLTPQQAQLQFTPWLGGLLLFPPLAYVLTLLGRCWVRQQQRHPGRQRQKRAAHTALAALHRLKKSATNDDMICEGVYRTLTTYISDKLDLPGAGLTADDVIQHLRSHGVEPELVAKVESLLHRCDRARYAPGALAVAQFTELFEDAEVVIKRLEAKALR